MTKLTDTEQVILTAVARNNGTVPTRELGFQSRSPCLWRGDCQPRQQGHP